VIIATFRATHLAGIVRDDALAWQNKVRPHGTRGAIKHSTGGKEPVDVFIELSVPARGALGVRATTLGAGGGLFRVKRDGGAVGDDSLGRVARAPVLRARLANGDLKALSPPIYFIAHLGVASAKQKCDAGENQSPSQMPDFPDHGHAVFSAHDG
jgi:hypothetical protein